MTDHTRTEKIGGDSIFIFVVFQVVAGNRYDSIFINPRNVEAIVNWEDNVGLIGTVFERASWGC